MDQASKDIAAIDYDEFRIAGRLERDAEGRYGLA